MRIARTSESATALLLCSILAPAYAPVESILYVEPPLRVLTQCAFTGIKGQTLSCNLGRWPQKIALTRGVGVWKGQDYKDTRVLRAGDRLDIKLGLDADGREGAVFIWANLVRIEGVVGAPYGRQWLRVFPLAGSGIGELADKPVLAYVDSGTTRHGVANPMQLPPGSPIIIIGQRLDNQRIRATRLISALPN